VLTEQQAAPSRAEAVLLWQGDALPMQSAAGNGIDRQPAM